MRIISDFHDYYDCIQQYGQDDTVIYLRKQKTLDIRHSSWELINVRGRVVGFCGSILLFVEFKTKGIRCWSLGDVDNYMRNSLTKSQFSAYKSSKRVTRHDIDRRVVFSNFFDKQRRYETKYEHIFRQQHTPIFVSKQREITINPCLKDIGFFTQFDTHSAFQEISMYMGGVLGTHGGHKTKYKGKPMCSEVSDIDLAQSKGFNKHSFRNSK